MIELRLLGSLDLRDEKGAEIRSILAQPRRLSLLAYLVLGSAAGSRRRDTLLGLFWPESDTRRARGALRNAIHFLRSALGPEVIESRTEEELVVRGVWCDAVEFERLLDRDRCQEALELYRGALLEGLYISEAPEFEQWVGEERERLRRRAVEGASRLADEAEAARSPGLAAHWARRALTLSLDEEDRARRLISLLWAAGDRSAALQAYEEFAARLAAVYDLEPAPETKALVESLRQEARTEASAAVAFGRPRSVEIHEPANPSEPVEPERRARSGPRLTLRLALPAALAIVLGAVLLPRLGGEPDTASSTDVVAVFPFAVSGGSDFGYLRNGLVTLLGANLDQAGAIRSVDPRALLDFVARDGRAPVDPVSARAIAGRFGAGSFVLGEVVETAGRLRITAALYEGGGRPREVVVEGDSTQVLALVDRLTVQILGVRSDSRLVRTALRTTSSLEALKSFLRGETARRDGRLDQAIEHFQSATSADSSFAMAYYRLSGTAYAAGRSRIPLEAGTAALRHAGRLAREDSLLVAAWVHHLQGRVDSAEALYRRAVTFRPSYVEAWEQLGELAFHWGPTRGSSPFEAREPFQRVLALEPHQIEPLLHLARLVAREGRVGAVDSLVARAYANQPGGGDWTLEMEAIRTFMGDDPAREDRAIRSIGAAPDRARGIVTSVASNTYDLEGAGRLARYLLGLDLAADERMKIELLRAQIEMGRGRFEEAERLLRASRTLPATRILEYRAMMAALPFRPVPEAVLLRLSEELDGLAAPPAIPPQEDPIWYRSAEFPPIVWQGLYEPRRHYLRGVIALKLRDST
ncbi:MAG: BTAD domain-containing putative transcriptional regulator, partial [Gemmatimonadota bacterium]